MTAQKTLLAIFAHPDDEILGSGGTIAREAANGVRVVLVCATRGEVGQISSPDLATPQTLGAVREEEMRCSARTLGIDELIFLDYRDSGMAGTPENDHPLAYVNAPAEEVVERLVGIIRRTRPNVIITFEPHGGYGHPDHIAANAHTLAALEAAADRKRFPEAGLPWQTPRVLYPILPYFFFVELRDLIAAHGGNVDDINLDERRDRGWPDELIHYVSDVADHVSAKFAAWDCHRTQFGPNSRFRRLPPSEMLSLLSKEYFALARPEVSSTYSLPGLFHQP